MPAIHRIDVKGGGVHNASMQTASDSHASKKVIGIVVGSVVCAGLFWLLPTAHGVANAVASHMRVAIAALATALYTGSAVWLISNLHFFKAKLRTAYALVGVGFIAFSLALLQLPIFGMLNLWDSFWISSGAAIVVFLLTTVLIYAGMRQYVRLVHAKSPAQSYRLIVVITLVFALITLYISPHLVWYPNVKGLPTYLAAVAASLGFLTGAAVLGWRLSRTMGASYRDAMRWLAIALTALAVGA
ncbi:MAG TPA: hypothetical protein VGO07_05435, partial [Candidatus Saccharimonadales bacterium]|nr:hypothetical protein [Candidatus Saccharimonadales bacterium]